MTRTVLVYGDSNSHGTAPMPTLLDMRRFGPDERWPGVMAAALGPGWRVIEEALPGRTTVHPDPVSGVHKNGLAVLPAVLESHHVRQGFTGPGGTAPALLVVCPPPVEEAGCLAEVFEGGAAKSRRLAPYYAEAAARWGAAFFDAGTVIGPSPVDGVHFEAADHRRLGQAIAAVVAGLTF
ncbi:MAG: hydrolase [Rhodobacteraceae bacterium]|nr:hydrolase [Paracoccaceae bacterium]